MYGTFLEEKNYDAAEYQTLISSAFTYRDILSLQSQKSKDGLFRPKTENSSEVLFRLKSETERLYDANYKTELERLKDEYKGKPCIHCLEIEENVPYVVKRFGTEEDKKKYKSRKDNKVKDLRIGLDAISLSESEVNSLFAKHNKHESHDLSCVYTDLEKKVNLYKKAEEKAASETFIKIIQIIQNTWNIPSELSRIFTAIIDRRTSPAPNYNALKGLVQALYEAICDPSNISKYGSTTDVLTDILKTLNSQQESPTQEQSNTKSHSKTQNKKTDSRSFGSVVQSSDTSENNTDNGLLFF